MKILIILFLVFGLVNVCYADRVCLEKSSGKLIDYQSGSINDFIALEGIPKDEQTEHIKKIKDNRKQSLVNNVLQQGYKIEDIEFKEITSQEWLAIDEEQIKKPIRKEAEKKEKERQKKEDKIKQVMNLTESDWQDLKSAFTD